MMAVYTIFKSN